jgi:hypothetical protein
MVLTTNATQSIQGYFQPLVGQAAWGVALGEGSFVTIEFGEVVSPESSAEKAHGTWHLWVYCCAWRLETQDDVLAYSEDDRGRLAEVVKSLEGQVLEGMAIDFPGGDTVLRFSGGLVLRLMPIYAEDYEHWILYMPEGSLVFGPGTRWGFEVEP